MGQRCQFGQGDIAGKADDAVIAGMGPQNGSGVFGESLLVILEMGAIGRADFDETRAALGHHFRESKGAADLDELPARDDDFLRRGQRGQHQHGGGGVIIDDSGRFRAGQFRQNVFDQFVTLGAFAGIAIDCQRATALQLAQDGIDHAGGQNGPAQTGVQDDAGGVDGFADMRFGGLEEKFSGLVQQGVGGSPRSGRVCAVKDAVAG